MSLETRLQNIGKDPLVDWVMGNVEEWRQTIKSEYYHRWAEYHRIWRGIWSAEDRQRLKERSRVIMPALQQAVDSSVAEIDEAVFARPRWFDISDDVLDQEQEDMLYKAILLREDLDLADVPNTCSQCWLLGAIYGTGIGKVVVERNAKRKNSAGITVSLAPVDPMEFVIDPVATHIEEALGVAHVTMVPRHIITAKQQKGIYKMMDPGHVGDGKDGNPNPAWPEGRGWTDSGKVEVTEYHGKVPAKWLGTEAEEDPLPFDEDGEENYVEAIVTVANKDTLLRAVKNPLKGGDRGFVAFQYESVPNTFWGRGVVERGYWPQKVLDTEVRARIDALAFSSNPMMALNSTVLARGSDMEARPGKNLFLAGEVAGNIQPITFPPPDPQTYRQTADMERMIEMATGQLQPASPEDINLKNSTASGISMMTSSALKRSRRTLLNIERNFLGPLIEKSLIRYQHFDKRYPKGDFRFKVVGTVGMMARELEMNQMIQLLQLLPQGSPPYWMMVSNLVELTSLSQREQIQQIVGSLLEQAQQPQEPERDLSGEARMLSAQARVQEVQARLQLEDRKLQVDEAKLLLQAEEQQRAKNDKLVELTTKVATQDVENVKTQADAILSIAKAEAAEMGSQLEQYKALVESLKTESPSPANGGTGELEERLEQLMAKMAELEARPAEGGPQRIDISRDDRGLVQSVNGLPVQRNPQTNLIEGIG